MPPALSRRARASRGSGRRGPRAAARARGHGHPPLRLPRRGALPPLAPPDVSARLSRVARAAALVLALAWALAGVPAGGEDGGEFRYVGLVFVKDARGKPVAGRRVELVRDKTGF